MVQGTYGTVRVLPTVVLSQYHYGQDSRFARARGRTSRPEDYMKRGRKDWGEGSSPYPTTRPENSNSEDNTKRAKKHQRKGPGHTVRRNHDEVVASKHGNGWIFVNDRHIVSGDPTLGPFTDFKEAQTAAKAHGKLTQK